MGLAPTSPLLTPNPAAFYTSRYGYKMCLRVYLNGDGTGRGTHLSLFFVVMKGPNDALLRWPFNQKVRELPCAAVGQSLRGEGAGTGARAPGLGRACGAVAERLVAPASTVRCRPPGRARVQGRAFLGRECP